MKSISREWRRSSIAWLSAALLLSLGGGRRPGGSLIEAIRAGDLNAVQRALAAGADVNAPAETGETPLLLAVRSGKEPLVALLLENEATDDPAKLFIEAVGAKSVPLCARFVRRIGSVNIKLPDGTTPLHRAAQSGDPGVMAWLLLRGPELNARREDGITALADACWYGNVDVALRLLASGADPNAATLKERRGPLHFAAMQGHDRLVEHLLALGANPSATELSGATPFQLALERGKSYAARLLHDYELERERIARRVTTARIDAASISPLRFATKNFAVPRTGWSRVFTDALEGSSPSGRWSSVKGADDEPLALSNTPDGSHRFLGKLGRQSARLSLTALPPHRAVSVRFELLILDSWDGGLYGTGWDRWILEVPGGPRLLETTFFNNNEDPAFERLGVQAFPGVSTQSFLPAMSGAIRKRRLGYRRDWDGTGTLYDRSALYDIEVVFPHTGSTLELDFTGAASQEADDESWGLDNVRVSVAR